MAPAVAGWRVVGSGALGRELIPTLRSTGIAELLMGAGMLAGVALSQLA